MAELSLTLKATQVLMEQSMTTLYARDVSHQITDRDPNFKVLDKSIEVVTLKNNGQIGPYTEKCFWLSLAAGLCYSGTELVNKTLELLQQFGFDKEEGTFDTANTRHLVTIYKFLVQYPDVTIIVFIGFKIKEKWHCSHADKDAAIFGNGPKKIRILNRSNHFELITLPNNMFLPILQLNKSQQEDLVKRQDRLWEQAKQSESDQILAILFREKDLLEQKLFEKDREIEEYKLVVEYKRSLREKEERKERKEKEEKEKEEKERKEKQIKEDEEFAIILARQYEKESDPDKLAQISVNLSDSLIALNLHKELNASILDFK